MAENGIVDDSKLPSTFSVVDRNSKGVGTVDTNPLDRIRPGRIIGHDGELVRCVGEWGFRSLNEPESPKPPNAVNGEIWVDADGVEQSLVTEW